MITSVENLNERISSCSKCLEDKLSGKDGKRHIVLCGGTGCLSSNSAEIRMRFEELLKEKGLDDKATVNQVGCFGFCSQGPFGKILPEDTLYRRVQVEDVEEIFNTDIVGGKVVERLLYVEPNTGEKVARQDDINFYKKQKRVALHGGGVINPDTGKFLVHTALKTDANGKEKYDSGANSHYPRASREDQQIYPTAWDDEWHLRSVAFNSGNLSEVTIALYGYGSQMWVDDMALFKNGEGTKYVGVNGKSNLQVNYYSELYTCTDNNTC